VSFTKHLLASRELNLGARYEKYWQYTIRSKWNCETNTI
jgi:hypothetical protein